MPETFAGMIVVRRASAFLFHAALLTLGWAGLAEAREIQVADRVFLVRDRGNAPTEFQMIVNAGCADEANGDCRGLAHYLEHLVLVGRNPENKDIAMRFFPEATSNGWTNQRATVFTHRIPARKDGPKADLEKLFAFYAARLDGFTIPPEEAARERNVVLQEHDWRLAQNAFTPMHRKLDRMLLPDHPLGQWTIGSPETIKSLTLDQAQAFHRAWYRKNNVWFVVKGDIEPEAVKAIAEAALGKITPQPLPERLSRVAPKFEPGRQDIEEAAEKVQRAGVIYKKLVRVNETDFPAENAVRMMLASFISTQLPGGLHDALVERGRLATGTPSFLLTRIAPGTYVISIGADLAQGADPHALRAAISAYVDGLATLDIPDKAIDRLKRRFADQRKTQDAIPGDVYGRLIQWLATPFDYEELNRINDRLAGLEKPQLAALLKQLAAPGRVVTGIVTPKEGTTQP